MSPLCADTNQYVFMQPINQRPTGYVRVQWEADLDVANSKPSTALAIQWQLFRDMEETPLQKGILEHSSAGSGHFGDSASGERTLGELVIDSIPLA
jgi:hypothetical protein